MNLSAKTKYACLAILELASQYGSNRPVPIREIAERHEIPSQFLVQILLQLKRNGLISSTRGAAGGYNLTTAPEEVSLGDVIRAIRGPGDESTDVEQGSSATRVLTKAWRRVEAVQREMLQNISLADLLGDIKSQDEKMYYI